MTKLLIALALGGVMALAAVPAPAYSLTDLHEVQAYCVTDLQKARSLIMTMPEGRHKNMAKRQMRLAMERPVRESGRCWLQLPVCVAPSGISGNDWPGIWRLTG